MARLSTFKKYFLTISVTFLLCLTFIILIVSFLINNYLSKDKIESLSISCTSVSNFVEKEYNDEGFERNLHKLVRTMSGVNQYTMIITDESGKVIACSCSDYSIDGVCAHSVNTVSSDILKKFVVGYEEIGKLGDMYNEMYYTAGKRIVVDSNTVGYVFASSPASTLTEFYGVLFKLYTFSAIIPIMILFFALYTATYRWVKPLKLMSEASRAMAKGDFSKRIPVMSNDEIGELSASFNSMTNSLVELENMRRSFIANVSHELKTPMTTIGGFIDGIIDGTIEPSKQNYYLSIVSDEVKRLSRLVQGMLSLSKLESGEIEIKHTAFDFRTLILDVVINQEQRIEEKGLTVLGLDNIKSAKIYADRDLMHQVVYNLCDNAVKFTDNNGEISFGLTVDSNELVFTVKNSGEGIPQKDIPMIFDRFYKGDRSRSANKDSTGLGLYLVKTIVKIHGGSVFVSSTENEFTQFGIRLPINKME